MAPLSRLARMQQDVRKGAARAAGAPRPKPVLEARPAAPSRPVAPPAPQPVLSQDYIQFLLNKVEDSGLESLTPNEVALLSRSFEKTTQAAPAPSAIDDVQIEAPDFDGNLAASELELDPPPSAGGKDNLRPKKAKGPTQLERLANEINNIAGSERTGEAIAPRQVRSTWSKVSALSSEDFANLVREMGNEDAALAKLERVQDIAGDAARDPNSIAAAAIDRARQAREGTMRAPGSNSPEFATDRLTAADMPTAADTARAVERERVLALDDRRAAPGLPRAERLARAGLDPEDAQAARKLPFFFKGSDRPIALESRSQGNRAGQATSSDKANIQQAEELEAAISQADADLRTAQYELRLAQISRTSGRGSATDADIQAMYDNLARAQGTYRALLDMEDELFPPRLIDSATGQPLRDDSGKIRRVPFIPYGLKGLRVERGVRGQTDSWLNRAGQAETYDDLLITAAGARPRAQRGLNRSSDQLTAGENASLADEALDEFGDDAIEFLPEQQEVLELVDDYYGKPRKVRGRPLPSRQRDALRRLFIDTRGGKNPIEMAGSAEAAVDEALSKNRVFRPGTANYDMARENLIKAVQDEFGGDGPTVLTKQEADARPAPLSSEPESVEGMAQDPSAVPALDGRANTAGEPLAPPARPDLSQPAMSPLQTPSPAAGYVPEPSQFSSDPNAAPVWQDKSVRRSTATAPVPNAPQASATARRRAAGAAARQQVDPSNPIGPPTAEEAKLAASSVDLGGSSPIPEKPAAAAGSQRVALSATEIKRQVNDAIDDAYRTAIDEGMSEADARAAAQQTGQKVRSELLEANKLADSTPIGDASGSPAAATPQPAPAAGKADDVVDSKPVDAPAGTKKNPKADAEKPKDGKDTKPKDGTDAKKADDKANPEKAPPAKGRIPYFRTALGIGGVLGGGALLSNMGGGGGTAVAGGGSMPLVPGGGVDSEAAMAEEDAINRALERLRGSRKGSDSPTYQTVQNWTVWR
jgi:hypothetical protein